MKHLFIVNPVAGGSDKTEFVREKAAECFAGRDEEYEVYSTKAPMDARHEIVRQAKLHERLRVYACGGDGTLNECLYGVYEAGNAQLTVFPTGTGNDFIKMFGQESRRFSDLRELVDGEERAIDIMLCNGRPGINTCSVGVDARIGFEVHKYSSLPLVGGATAYVVSTLVNFVRGLTQPAKVTCGGEVFDGELTLTCACNGQYYGGGFNPVPDARPDDGLLDFLIIPRISRLKFVFLVGQFAKGKYKSYPQYIRHVRGESITIELREEDVLGIDGEGIYGKKAEIRVVPGGVSFIFPSQMAFFASQKEQARV